MNEHGRMTNERERTSTQPVPSGVSLSSSTLLIYTATFLVKQHFPKKHVKAYHEWAREKTILIIKYRSLHYGYIDVAENGKLQKNLTSKTAMLSFLLLMIQLHLSIYSIIQCQVMEFTCSHAVANHHQKYSVYLVVRKQKFPDIQCLAFKQMLVNIFIRMGTKLAVRGCAVDRFYLRVVHPSTEHYVFRSSQETEDKLSLSLTGTKYK